MSGRGRATRRRRSVSVTLWAKMPWGWVQRGRGGRVLPDGEAARIVRVEGADVDLPWLAHHRGGKCMGRFRSLDEARAWAVSDTPDRWPEAQHRGR